MLLFDTETFNLNGKRFIWEFAGIDTKSLQTFHYLNGSNLRQALAGKCNADQLMFFNRYQLKHACKYIWLENDDFIDCISNVIGRYRILTAYNISFDVGVLSNIGLVLDDYKLLDLWGSFVKIIGCTKKYIIWCNNNGYLTKTKLPRTDAETAYRYLSGSQSFSTPHLAIKDVEHELVIYKALQKRKKSKHYGFFGYNDLKNYYIEQEN